MAGANTDESRLDANAYGSRDASPVDSVAVTDDVLQCCFLTVGLRQLALTIQPFGGRLLPAT